MPPATAADFASSSGSATGSTAAAADGSRASTSLPPRVRGSARGFLALSLDSVVWYATSREFSTRRPACTLDHGSTMVRLAWWGEQGAGSVWAPECIGLDSEGNVVARHAPVAPAAAPARSHHGHRETEVAAPAPLPQTVVYPIVVSPSSLMNYLSDAQWLVFELHHFAETDPAALQRDWMKTLSRAAHASRAAPQAKPPLAHCMFDLAPLTEALGIGAREWAQAKNVPIVIAGVPVGHVSLRISCRIQGDATGAPTGVPALGDAPRLAPGFDSLDDGGFGAIPEQPKRQQQQQKATAPPASSSPLDDFPSNVPFTSSYRGPPAAASDPIRGGESSKLDARDAFDMANISISALIAESEAVSKGIEQSMAFVPNRVVGPMGASAAARDHAAEESTPSPSLQASPMKASQPPQPHPYPQRQQQQQQQQALHSQSMRERESGTASAGQFDMAASLPPNGGATTGGFSASSSRAGPPPSQTPFVQHSFSSRAPAASASSSFRPQQAPAASASAAPTTRLPSFASTPAASYIADFAPAPSEFFGGPVLPPAAAGPLPPPFHLARPPTTRTDPDSAIDEGNLITVWIKLSKVELDTTLDPSKQGEQMAASLKQHQLHRQHVAHSKGTLDSQRRGDYLVVHYSLFPEVGMSRSAPVFAPRCSASRPAILGPHWDSSPRVFSRSWVENLATGRASVPMEIYAYKKRPSWKDARDPVSGKFLPQAPLQTILARAELGLAALASLPLTLPAPESFSAHDPARHSELIRFLRGCTAFNGRLPLLDPANPLPTAIGSMDVSFGWGSAQALARLQKMESAATMLQRAARGFLERRRARRRKIARELQREQEEDAEEERLDAEEAAAQQQQQQDQYPSLSGLGSTAATATAAGAGADSHRSTFSTPSRSVSASPRVTAASGGGFAAAALRAQAVAHGQQQQQLNFRLNLPLSPSSRGVSAVAPGSARKSSLASSTSHAHDVATSPLPQPLPQPLQQQQPVFVPAPRAEDKKDFLSFSFARGSRSSALQSIGDQKREQSTRTFADSLRLIEQAREDLAQAKAGVTGRTPMKSPPPPQPQQGLSPPHSQLREKEREAQERAAKLAEDSWMQQQQQQQQRQEQQQHRSPQPAAMQQAQMASPPRVRAVQPSPPRNQRSTPAAAAATAAVDSDAEAYSEVSDFEDEDYDEDYAVSTDSLSPPRPSAATASASRGSQLVSSFDPSSLDASTARERLQQQLAELGELQRRLQWKLDGGRMEDLPKQQTQTQTQQQQLSPSQSQPQSRSPLQLQSQQQESKQSLSPPHSSVAATASSSVRADSTPSTPNALFQSPQPSGVSSSPSSSDLPHMFRATELSSLLTITPLRNAQQQQRAMAATPNTPNPFLGFPSPSPPAQQQQQQSQGERPSPPPAAAPAASFVSLSEFAPSSSALPPAHSPSLARGASESSIPEVLSVEPPPAGSERVASPPLHIQEVNIDNTRLPPQPQQAQQAQQQQTQQGQAARSPPVNRWLEHGHLSPSRIGERSDAGAAPAATVTRSSPVAASASVEYSDYGSDVSSGSSGGESDSEDEEGEEDDRPRRASDWALRVSAPPGMAVKVQYSTEPQGSSSADAAAERARLFPRGLRGESAGAAEPGAAAVPSRASSSGSTLFLGGHSSSSQSRWDARFQPTEEDARRAEQIARIMQQHTTHTD